MWAYITSCLRIYAVSVTSMPNYPNSGYILQLKPLCLSLKQNNLLPEQLKKLNVVKCHNNYEIHNFLSSKCCLDSGKHVVKCVSIHDKYQFLLYIWSHYDVVLNHRLHLAKDDEMCFL